MDIGKQGLDVSGRANFMLRLQTPSVRLKTPHTVADPDRDTEFLEPGQKFQIWMKMDKNLIFCKVFLAPNPVNILSRSATASRQANYTHGLPKYVDQFTIAISHNTDVTKLKHHTGRKITAWVSLWLGQSMGSFGPTHQGLQLRPIFCLCTCWLFKPKW